MQYYVRDITVGHELYGASVHPEILISDFTVGMIIEGSVYTCK